MRTRLFLLMCMAAVTILASSMVASDIGLADWCVNNNGSVGPGADQPSNSCNGGALPADPNVNTTGFDTTTELSTNAVATSPQSITIAFGTGAQNIGVFMNYDIDFNEFGSNGDYGTVVGAFPAPFSYEMDNEFTSGIFTDFAAGALTNANNVDFATCSGNSPSYCDVSWAMDWTAIIDPTKFKGGTITYTASTTVPTAGFYLQQTSGLSCQVSGGTGPGCDNLFLSATVKLTPVGGGGGTIPEPGTWLLFSTVVSVLFAGRRRFLARGLGRRGLE